MDHSPRDTIGLLRLALAVAIAMGFFYSLGAFPLFDLDEGAFSEATREMLARSDFISPWLYGAPRFDKPVMIHWLQMVSVGALGWNEVALRLPSALAASLWVLAVYGFLRRVKDEVTGIYAAAAMALSLEIPVIAKAAIADAVLNLFLTAALLAAYLHHREQHKGWLYACFAAMGLGFLTKGPVAVLIPLATTLVFYVSRGEFRAWLRAAFHPGGLLLFVAIALPWYLAQYLHQGNAFIRSFFLQHNLGRFENPMESHRGTVLYYLPVVVLGVLPYTTLLFSTLARSRALWRDDVARYALIWFGFVFIFFSLSGTKLPHYVVYGYPGLFILMALNADRLPPRGWLLLPPLLLFLALLVLPPVIGGALPLIKDPYVHDMLENLGEYVGPGWYAYFAAAAALTLLLMIGRSFGKGIKLYLCGLLTVIGVSGLLLPTVAGLQQSPIKEAALLSKARGYNVVMWGLNTPSFAVYAQRLVERRDPRPGDVVLTKAANLARLPVSEVLYRKNGIVLVRVAGHPLPQAPSASGS